MAPPRPPSATVLICTYNRAGLLDATLASLRRLPTRRHWDILVVDNNSTDDTRDVVMRHAAVSPVPLTWLFEGTQGKSVGLNAGINHSRGDIIVFTDDDVIVEDAWLDAACTSLESDLRY